MHSINSITKTVIELDHGNKIDVLLLDFNRTFHKVPYKDYIHCKINTKWYILTVELDC